MTTIVVCGALANKPFNGGEAWVRLSWILGFQRLGCEVYFVEQIDRDTCVDASGAVTSFAQSINLAYFRQVADQFGLMDRVALIFQQGEQVYGASKDELFALAERSELLINISGHLTWEPLLTRFNYRAYIDIDPGFTQFWHADPTSTFRLQGHEVYFTIGENIGARDCDIPTDTIEWKHIRQPVVLEEWPVCHEDTFSRFTTIASWRGAFGPVYVGERHYGLKVHEFRKFISLPQRLPYAFEIALQIYPGDAKDREHLCNSGWQIVDPQHVASNPADFRSYIQQAGAEFSVAQGIYVDTNSGWFSDRSVRYLASGKPVLIQDTGFSRNYPVGEGIVPFRTLDEARSGAETIAQNYARHQEAARAHAESYFDSDKVLAQLLDEVGCTSSV